MPRKGLAQKHRPTRWQPERAVAAAGVGNLDAPRRPASFDLMSRSGQWRQRQYFENCETKSDSGQLRGRRETKHFAADPPLSFQMTPDSSMQNARNPVTPPSTGTAVA